MTSRVFLRFIYDTSSVYSSCHRVHNLDRGVEGGERVGNEERYLSRDPRVRSYATACCIVNIVRYILANAGLTESNGSLLPGLWRDSLHVTCGLTACTPGSAPGPTLGNEYGKTLPLPLHFGRLPRHADSLTHPIWLLQAMLRLVD